MTMTQIERDCELIAESFSAEIACIKITNGSACAEFLPSHGGILNRLRLDTGSGTQEVIAGLHDIESLMNNREYRGVHLFPFPNRLNRGRYAFAGHQYQFPINEMELDNALHGFLYRKNPDQIIQSEQHALQMIFICDGSDDYFPFPCSVIIEYELQSTAAFVARFSVINNGTTDLPFGIGWHPYFTLNQPIDELALHLPPVQRVIVDSRMLPTRQKAAYDDFSVLKKIGHCRLDTCFEIQDTGDHETSDTPYTKLWSEDQQIGLEIWQDDGENGCRFLQICTAADRYSLAIEPMSCSIDAFNSGDGLRTLKAGESFSTGFGVRLVTA